MERFDIKAFEAARKGDKDQLMELIDNVLVNQHDVFATAVKNNRDSIIEWMMREVMTQQCYPLGRLDVAVVADIIVKHGTQNHLELLCDMSRSDIKGLLRPEHLEYAHKRGLNIV
ncbi:hypothetical protein F-liban_428 [Faustovirus]|nr:hypothetical protein F-liban_428 [Faustovirus]SME65119.1 Hypothetical protein FSTVST1_418 [Faustovirus ST1]